MIDENKIEEAASTYGTSNGYSCIGPYGRMSLKPELETAFETGAHWAINELSKDLVHPASENAKIALLKEIAIYYSGQTINSIIQQLEAIRKDVSND